MINSIFNFKIYENYFTFNTDIPTLINPWDIVLFIDDTYVDNKTFLLTYIDNLYKIEFIYKINFSFLAFTIKNENFKTNIILNFKNFQSDFNKSIILLKRTLPFSFLYSGNFKVSNCSFNNTYYSSNQDTFISYCDGIKDTSTIKFSHSTENENIYLLSLKDLSNVSIPNGKYLVELDFNKEDAFYE